MHVGKNGRGLLFVRLGIAAVFLSATASALIISSAQAAGVGSVCGSRGLKPCDAGLFCDFPVSAKCGEADHPGKCAARPQMCTREYRPVCGCDGKTYGNDCDRRSHGVAKRHDGQC